MFKILHVDKKGNRRRSLLYRNVKRKNNLLSKSIILNPSTADEKRDEGNGPESLG